MPAVKQRGIALLEVLISLVVISVGLLGLAALQIGSMKDTQQTRYYEIASYGLSQLLERLSSNADGVKNQYYDFNNLSVQNKDKNPEEGCSNDSTAPRCLARSELKTWLQQLSGLPQPRVSISTTAVAGGSEVTAKIVWNAALRDASNVDYTTACDKTNVSSYQCNQIVVWIKQ